MTRFFAILLALPAFTLALAQYNYGSSSAGTKTTMMAASTAMSSSSSIHSIAVGQGGLKFVPDMIMAKVGDQVEFNFVSAGHSVAEGDFMHACQPKDAMAFFSGYPITPGGKPFTITVNSTEPMWFYCTAPTHCQSGMVGVINPPSGETVDEYAKAAEKTSKSSAPAKVQGGTFGAAMSQSGSTGTASTASMSASSSASSSPTSSSGAAPGQLLMESLGVSLPIGFLGYMLL